MTIMGLIALSMICGTIIAVVLIRSLFGPHGPNKK